MNHDNTYLIVGLGSIGRRHLECLRKIDHESRIIVWRQLHKESNVPDGADHVVFDLDSALSYKPDCAIVANPAPMHVHTALSLAKAGVHLLVEKPLSNSMKQVDELICLCKKKKLVLMVAYVLRFNPSLNAFCKYIKSRHIGKILSFRVEVGQYLPDWRPGSNYKEGVSARQDLGGGALLELSHELDYIRWVFGEVISLSALVKNSGFLGIDVDDMVDSIMEIEMSGSNAAVGSVHLDMLQREPVRGCRAVCEQGMLEWDGIKNSVRYFNRKIGQWEIIFHTPNLERNYMYISQTKNFLEAVYSNSKPRIDGSDGKAVLAIIQAIRQSSELNRKVVLL